MGQRKNFLVIILVIITLMTVLITGCTENNNSVNDTSKEPKSNDGSAKTEGSVDTSEAPEITIVRTVNPAPEPGHPYVKYVTEQTGIKPLVSSFPGNYNEGLQTMFASGENIPDVFRPLRSGLDETLINQNAAVPLDDLLQEYAPHLWENIPMEVWNIVRSNSSDEKIYWIPQAYVDYAERGWFIRQDWLDTLNLEIPKTKEELVTVLKAFRDGDPNGNGLKDEIPTGAEKGPNWLHGFFDMYGIPFFGETPEWDLVDGKVTYGPVMPHAKEAVEFMKMLYDEKLLDPETFLNTADTWKAKISEDKVGLWYHVIHQIDTFAGANLMQKNPNARITGLAPPKVPGVDGFVTRLRVANKDWMIPKVNEENAANVLTYLDWFETEEGKNFVAYGIEGETWEKGKDGKIIYYAEKDSPELFTARYHGLKGLQAGYPEFYHEAIMGPKPYGLGDMAVEAAKIAYNASKTIAGDGMPLSVYNDYPDAQDHKLYKEYLTKIVIGDWPLEKWDEFEEKWYKNGGEEITKRVNEWYSIVEKLQANIK